MIIQQSKLVAIFLALGIILGVIYKIIQFVQKCTKNNKAFVIGSDLIFSICSGLAVIYLFAIYNLGIVRLYLIATLALGIVITHITIKKLFATTAKMLYNKLEIWKTNFKNSKIHSIIFK